MANVQRGVVPVPNKPGRAGDLAHSSGGLSSQPPGTHAANDMRSAPIGSSGPMSRHGSPMNPPNNAAKFNVSDATRGYDAPVTSPGKGAIEVDARSPLSGGSVQGSSLLRDTAKR